MVLQREGLVKSGSIKRKVLRGSDRCWGKYGQSKRRKLTGHSYMTGIRQAGNKDLLKREVKDDKNGKQGEKKGLGESAGSELFRTFARGALNR